MHKPAQVHAAHPQRPGSELPGLDFATVLASTIHDMKNSLGLLLQTIEVLEKQRGNMAPKSAVQFRELRYESQRLNSQLMQLLAIYKLQKQLYSPNIEEWSVAEILEECVLEHTAQLEGRDIHIQWQCAEELSGFFDRELINGVINNIVNNAYRYARNQVLLTAQAYTHPVGSGIEICVIDDGPGYPEALLFDHNRDITTLDFHAGRTGLGLYFCSLVADLHRNKTVRGHVACDNTGIEGGGCFRLYLP